MRIPFICGNWKMYKTKEEAAAFAAAFRGLYEAADTDIAAAICAPFTQLDTLKEAFAGTRIGVGAQNVHFAEEGAYTGEISAAMLQEIGVDYCIVGHSERRQYFGETDETVNLKAVRYYGYHSDPLRWREPGTERSRRGAAGRRRAAVGRSCGNLSGERGKAGHRL